jgi:hypothetical protein
MLTLTFFKNHHDVAIGDLYLGERRLIATNHPATLVAAMFAMKRKQLKVTTLVGSHTGVIDFPSGEEPFTPLPVLKMRMDINPRLYQFRHLAADESEAAILEGLDLFSQDNWYEPSDRADEYIRAAYHHLPPDVIERQLTKPAPKNWKKTLKARNEFIYFPEC